MTAGKNKILFILLFIATKQILVFSQTNDCIFKEKLIFEEIEISLLCNFKKHIQSYDEGVFISFTYPDSSHVVIFDGSMTGFPLLSKEMGYLPCYTDTINNKIVIKGLKNGKCWREDVITKNLRIYYDYVPFCKKEQFDNILESLILISE